MNKSHVYEITMNDDTSLYMAVLHFLFHITMYAYMSSYIYMAIPICIRDIFLIL